jgi:hypothetical protein
MPHTLLPNPDSPTPCTAAMPCHGRHRLHLRRAALAVVLAAAASAASAQSAITLYGGARGGGEFEDANNGNQSLALDSGAAVSASVDWRMADGRQGQVFYSFQRSALPGSAFGQSGDVSVDISYLHLGGRAFFEGTAATAGAYVVGGLGATWFSPGLSGLSDEIRPSVNLGVGYQWPLAPNIALRAELRSYVSLINSSGEFFCSGGCVVAIRGDALVQVEGLLGLSIGF